MERPIAAALVLAREARGFSQSALAQAMNVSQGYLSKVENSQQEFSSELAERAALALGFPETFFYQEDIDRRNLPVAFYRKRMSLKAGDIRRITAEVNIVRQRVKVLLRSADVPLNVVPSVDLHEFRSTPADVANDLRIRWHLPPGPVVDLSAVLESKGVLIVDTDFGVNKIDALSIFDPADGLPPIIFSNPDFPGDRQRWTLAHELGHIVLHHHLALPGPHVEDEANEFASAFLMPGSDLRPYLRGLSLPRLADLKIKWKVSMAALIMRAHQLGAITSGQKVRLFQQMAPYRVNEPVQVERESASLMKKLIGLHLDSLGYTRDELAAAMHASRQDLDRAYPPQGLRIVR